MRSPVKLTELKVAFHAHSTNAGRVTLHNDACNAERMVATGNPCKEPLSDLMKRGVRVEITEWD